MNRATYSDNIATNYLTKAAKLARPTSTPFRSGRRIRPSEVAEVRSRNRTTSKCSLQLIKVYFIHFTTPKIRIQFAFV